MRRIFILLFLVTMLVGCTKSKNEIVMVTEAGFAPYEYYENGKIIGVDIEISEKIAEKLGKKLVVKDIAFDSIINELNSGKADFAAAGMSISEERKEKVDFSLEYITSNQVVVVRSDSDIKSIDEIKDKRISVQLGTVADSYVTENYKDAKINRLKKFLVAAEDVKNNKDIDIKKYYEKEKDYSNKFTNSINTLSNNINKTSRKIIADEIGESHEQVRRYIRLTYLVPELLKIVDEDKMGLRIAVELSYLTEDEQKIVADNMEYLDVVPSHAQARIMRNKSEKGELTNEEIEILLEEEKPNQKEQIKFKYDKVKDYFPSGYSIEKMQEVITELLESYQAEWKRKKQRDNSKNKYICV